MNLKDWKKEHDFAEGDLFARVIKVQRDSTKASVQIDTDAAFDGTNTEAKLVQSNNYELNPALWHDLPEKAIKLPTGEGSALLSTFSFTCQFLAVVITAGNATTGTAQLSNKFNSNT